MNVQAFTPQKLPDMQVTKAAAFRRLLSNAQRQVRVIGVHVTSVTLSLITAVLQGQLCQPEGTSCDIPIASHMTSTVPLLTCRQNFRHGAT